MPHHLRPHIFGAETMAIFIYLGVHTNIHTTSNRTRCWDVVGYLQNVSVILSNMEDNVTSASSSRLPEPEFNQDKEEIHQFDETIIPPSPSPHHTDMIYLPRQKKARLLICISQLFSELSEWIWQFSTVVWLSHHWDPAVH